MCLVGLHCDKEVRSLLKQGHPKLVTYNFCHLAQSKRCCKLAYPLITSIDGRTWLAFLISAMGMTPRSSRTCLLYLSGLVLRYEVKNLKVVQSLLVRSCRSRGVLLEKDIGLQRASLSTCRLRWCRLVGNGPAACLMIPQWFLDKHWVLSCGFLS